MMPCLVGSPEQALSSVSQAFPLLGRTPSHPAGQLGARSGLSPGGRQAATVCIAQDAIDGGQKAPVPRPCAATQRGPWSGFELKAESEPS